MFEKIKSAFCWLKNWLLCEMSEDNTYCIPCKWILAGHVYVDAPDIETAKTYVRVHNIPPELEKCVKYAMIADTSHPILCTCGNCGEKYIISPIHNPQACPKCGNGGENK